MLIMYNLQVCRSLPLYDISVMYLSCGFHPLEDAEVNNDPGKDQNKEKFPSDCSCQLNSTGLIQHLVSWKKVKIRRTDRIHVL